MSLALAACVDGRMIAGAVNQGRLAALRARAGVGAAIAFGADREAQADALMQALAEGLDAGGAMARIAASAPRGHDGFFAVIDAGGRTADLHGAAAPSVSAAASRPACVAMADGAPSARAASALVSAFVRAPGDPAARLGAALGGEADLLVDPPI